MMSLLVLSSSTSSPSLSVSNSHSHYLLTGSRSQQQQQQQQPFSSSSFISRNPPKLNLKIMKTKRNRSSLGAVCYSTPLLAPQNLQWLSTVASAVLMIASGTAVQKSFLVPLLALQAPNSVISWIKGEYGTWTVFLALLVRLFYFIPGALFTYVVQSVENDQSVSTLIGNRLAGNTMWAKLGFRLSRQLSTLIGFTNTLSLAWYLHHNLLGELELPLVAMLLVITAPYKMINLRGTQTGAIVSLVIAAYLAYQHFSRLGGLQKALDQGSAIASVAIACIIAVPCLLLI